METAGLWDELKTDWVCLDCEIMPWSLKAKELLRQQYAAVGAAGAHSVAAVVSALDSARASGLETGELLKAFSQRAKAIDAFVHAYRHYCWDFRTLEDIKVAPFHLLASEGTVHTDKNHHWHMETIRKICERSHELLLATPYRTVSLENTDEVDGAIAWWNELTAEGGEGIVVKPLDFIVKGKKGLIQPAVKCRGQEYLRIIYGPEYDLPENIVRLRERGLSRKRSLALREFALGVESLERFVRKDPLRKTHECAFGVLALESEGVDPRL